MSMSRTNVAVSAADSRRAAIADAAAALFDREGYANTSMNSIASALGIAKPTLYHYFSGKEDLLAFIHNVFMDVLLDGHSERLQSGLTGLDLVHGIMRDILGVMHSHPGYVRIFIENFQQLPEDVKITQKKRRDAYHDALKNSLEQAYDAGQVNEIDLELTTLAIFGMCNWAYQWYDVSGLRSPDQIADKFIEIIDFGIRCRPR